ECCRSKRLRPRKFSSGFGGARRNRPANLSGLRSADSSPGQPITVKTFRKIFIFLCAIFAFARPASAAMVDWSGLTWTPGSLSNSYDVDAGSPGNDVTVTISGDTGQLQTSLAAGNPQTPAITRAFDGGLGISPQTLELALNLANNTQSVTFTLDFSALYAAG